MKALLRTWQEFDLKDVEKFLIVHGELSAECYACHKIGLELKAISCSNCGTYFKYIGFRRKVTISYLHKLRQETPHLTLIDFDDFKKATGNQDARRLLDL